MKIDSIEEACQKTGDDLQQIEAAAAMMPEWLQKSIRATALKMVVVKAMNEGKIPDATDGTVKYEPVFDLTADNGPSGFGLAFDFTYNCYTFASVGTRLQLLDEEDCEHFATHPAFMQLHADSLTYKASETNGKD